MLTVRNAHLDPAPAQVGPEISTATVAALVLWGLVMVGCAAASDSAQGDRIDIVAAGAGLS